jgi:hypothetical protein
VTRRRRRGPSDPSGGIAVAGRQLPPRPSEASPTARRAAVHGTPVTGRLRSPPYPAAAPASTTARPLPSRHERREPGRCHSDGPERRDLSRRRPRYTPEPTRSPARRSDSARQARPSGRYCTASQLLAGVRRAEHRRTARPRRRRRDLAAAQHRPGPRGRLAGRRLPRAADRRIYSVISSALTWPYATADGAQRGQE